MSRGEQERCGKENKVIGFAFQRDAVASVWRLGETEEDGDPSGDMQVHIFFNLNNT